MLCLHYLWSIAVLKGARDMTSNPILNNKTRERHNTGGGDVNLQTVKPLK
jgi:hypothetical protein